MPPDPLGRLRRGLGEFCVLQVEMVVVIGDFGLLLYSNWFRADSKYWLCHALLG
jgi:hypothetical protein